MKVQEIEIDALLDELKRLKEENTSLRKQIQNPAQSQYFSSIVKNETDVFWQVDNNFIFRYISTAFEKMLGYKSEELMGKHLFSIMPEESRKQILNGSNKRQEKEKERIKAPQLTVEMEVLRVDGTRVWNEILVCPVYSTTGSFEGLQGISRDIDVRKKAEIALKASEMRLKMITENMLDMISQIDVERRLIYVSPSVEAILGYSVKEVLNQNIFLYIHQDDIDRLVKIIRNAIDNKEDNIQYEFKIRHKNGNYLWVESKAKLLFDENDVYTGALFGSRVIHERKISEQQLLETTQELKELNATKDKFFSIIAHDLKNPFNLIIGFSELLKNNMVEYDKETILSFVNIIHDTSKRGHNLLLNLLDWSRTQSGRLEYKPQRLNLNNLIFENVDALQGTADLKRIEIMAEFSESVYVMADIYMLNTVMRNLLSNAIKFSYQDGIIRVKTRKAGPFVEVLIEDKGKGIPKDDLKKLFRMDLNYTSNGTANEKGTGLGLIICKEFIERCKGKIYVESEAEKGTTIRFTLQETN